MMKHVLLLIVLLATNYCYGQQVKYISPDKDFFVIFPQKPELSTDTITLADGISTIFYYMAEPDNELYSLSSLDLLAVPTQANIKDIFAEAPTSYTQGNKVTDIQTLSIDVDSKYPNVFFMFKTSKKMNYVRMYLYKSIQYVAAVTYRIDDPEPAAVKVFFDSFKILD